MKRNNKVHHRDKERTDVLQFEQEKEKRRSCAHLKNKETSKQSCQNVHKECKANKKSKDKILVIGGIFISLLIVTVLFEYVCYDHIGLVDGIGSIVALVGLVISVCVEADRHDYYDEKNFCRRVIDGILWLKSTWRSKPVFTFLLVVLVIINLSAFFAKYTVCSRIAYAAEKGITAFINYKEKSYVKSGNDRGALGISAVCYKTTSEEKVNDKIKSSDTEDSLYIFTEEEMIEQFGIENYQVIQNIIVTQDDRDRELNLSTSHYNDIFHQEGEFAIEDWNDQQEIDATILQMVRDEVELKKVNQFDSVDPSKGASEKVRAEINAASEKEKGEHTFSERIEMMGTRAGNYGLHPKSSLAKLVSNDNQALALTLVVIGGKKQTEIYYYGEAILWGREYIGFADVSANSVKEKLNWIAERYNDIRFICSEGDPEYEYAEKLMIAYRHAADEF